MKGMTLLQMKDKKNTLIGENDTLFDLIETEKRSLTAEERTKVEGNLSTLAELELMIQTEMRKSPEFNPGQPVNKGKPAEEEKPPVSLIAAINARIENRDGGDAIRSMRELASQQFRAAGVTARGDIMIPAVEQRADIAAGTADHGAEIVATDKMPILPPLVDKLVFTKAGATYLNNLIGNVSVPSYAGTTADWASENGEVTETGGTFDEVTFSPKRLAAVLDVSKLFLAQDSVGAEQLLYNNIVDAVARKLESTILGTDTASATKPGGMAFGITKGDTAAVVHPTRANVVALETTTATNNVDETKLAYITNSAGRGILKNIIDGPSGVGRFLLENGQMNGYPVLVTNAAPANCGAGSSGNFLVFGNWADLCICQWGGYDITVDPYTVANKGQVRLVINAYFDAKGLRGRVASGSGYDDYAISFAKVAIV